MDNNLLPFTVSIICSENDANKYLNNCLQYIAPIFSQINILINKISDYETDIIKVKKEGNINVYNCAINELNFASLRNKIDAYARSEWIISLDADDILHFDINEFARIAKLPKNIGGVVVDTLVYNGDNELTVAPQVKIYRNNGYRWQYRVHEQIHQAITKNEQLTKSTISIKHIGYIGDEAHYMAKTRRNIDLCLKELSENHSKHIEFHLAMHLKFLFDKGYYGNFELIGHKAISEN